MASNFVGTRTCNCGKTYPITRVQRDAPHKSYCSRVCMCKFRVAGLRSKYILKKVNPSWFKKGEVSGTPFPKGHCPANFKEEGVGYDALHDWVNRHAGLAKKCLTCGSTTTVHWANYSGNYLRDLSDWISLCVPCHRKHDRTQIPGAMVRKFPAWYEKRRVYQRKYRANKREQRP